MSAAVYDEIEATAMTWYRYSWGYRYPLDCHKRHAATPSCAAPPLRSALYQHVGAAAYRAIIRHRRGADIALLCNHTVTLGTTGTTALSLSGSLPCSHAFVRRATCNATHEITIVR